MSDSTPLPPRPTRAIINADALRHNIDYIRGINQGVEICAPVKAEAYGHGLIETTKILHSLGVKWFAVSILEEAIQLRNAGLDAHILVLGGLDENQAQWYARHNIVATAPSLEKLHILNTAAQAGGVKIRVHIKIDTGMGRLGVQWDRIERFAKELHSFNHLDIEGVYTHLACADEETGFSETQLGRFKKARDILHLCNTEPRIIHTLNSAGVIKNLDSSSTMIRPGLMVYGVSPVEEYQKFLRPVLSLVSKISYVKTLLRGGVVGYGSIYVVQEEHERIATIPIGYGDGLFRSLSNKGEVLIRGRRYPIVGRICMDQLMVSLGKDGIGYNGDEVVFIGTQEKEEITVQEVARHAQTIPYEILTSISGRVPRVYL